MRLSTDPLRAAMSPQWPGRGWGPVLGERGWGDAARVQGGRSKPPARTVVCPPGPGWQGQAGERQAGLVWAGTDRGTQGKGAEVGMDRHRMGKGQADLGPGEAGMGRQGT